MHSIRVRITAITIVAILTSILFVFAASFQILRSETDQNSVRMMNLIGEDTRKSLEKYFESVEQSVEITANTAIEDLDTVFLVENGALQAADSEKPRTPEQTNALDAYLRSHCAGIQSFFAGVADYTQGVSAYYYCISPEISQNERGFFYLKIGKAGFIEQEPLYVERLLPRENLNATWYEAAVSRGRPAWIGPYISVSEGDIWICSFFVPIYKAGTLIGVMGMDIPCDTLVAQVSGVRIYDTGYQRLMHAGTSSDAGMNWHMDILKAWTPENTNTDVPALNSKETYANGTSDRWLISSNYVALQNITLGYTFPSKLTKKAHIEKIRLFAVADNVALWSARKGLDPRQGYASANTIFYSPMRAISGGLSITF